MGTFNGEMVIVARESRGITQRELATKLNISAAQLSRIEVGLRGLRNTSLQQKLEEVLAYPNEFFFQRNLIYGIGISEVFHRKRHSVSDRMLNKVYAQIYLRTTELSKILNNVELSIGRIQPININDFDGDSAEIARITRASWRLPHGPIKNLVGDIENAGGIVIPFDFETNTIDAISHWPHNMPPLFFINKFNPTDRVRFTLCHELAHIIMHRTVEANSEQQADEFAAEFLMPAKDIKTDLADVSLQKLAFMKPVWRVSMAALLKRAVDLCQITPRHSRTLWMTMGKLGYRTREPIEADIPAEQPHLLDQIIDTHLGELGYSVADLSKMLCLYENETRDIYIEPKQSLKGLRRGISLREEKKAAVKKVEQLLRDLHDKDTRDK